MRRRLLPGVIVLAALLTGAVGGGPARAAGGPVVTGVWWRAQSDGGTLPPPAQVTAHQLWVSSDPSGPSAISAVHVDLAADEVVSALTLHVAGLTAAPAMPAAPMQAPVLACVTTGAWKAVDASTPGAWNARPKYECAKGQVQGSLSADQKTLTFDLASIGVPGAALDVALVPGLVANPIPSPPVPPPVPLPDTPASGNASPTFDVTFAPPTAADVAVDPVASAGAGTVAASQAGADVAPALDSPALTGPAPFTAALGAPTAATAGTPAPLGPPLVNLVRPAFRPAALAADTTTGTRVLAGLVFAALMAWAWLQVTVESRTDAAAATGRRPRLTLYDVPAAPSTRVTARHFAATTRTGRPPPLR
jgi:hypothetical protein